MKLTVSAPGKLHLSGEHAVVAGYPALLVSTSKRIYVTIESDQPSALSDQHTIENIKKENNYVGRVVNLVEKKYKTVFKDFSVTIRSDIPAGAGMGSSAALAVATVGALREYLKLPWNVQAINEVAYEAEKLQHGNPSGGDNTIVSFGGILWYRKEFDFLKTFWLLQFKIPKAFNNFVLINTGREETTGELVNFVSHLGISSQEKYFREIEKITKKITQSIHDEKEQEFKTALSANEKILEKLGVVSPMTQKLIRTIEEKGGFAKISGAGGRKKGSGIIIALHEKPQQLFEIAKEFKYDAFQVALGGEGVRREQLVV